MAMTTQTTSRKAAAPMLQVRTTVQMEREARDRAIYEEYHRLAANPQQSRVALLRYFMEKYDFHSTSTLYAILRRVEASRNH